MLEDGRRPGAQKLGESGERPVVREGGAAGRKGGEARCELDVARGGEEWADDAATGRRDDGIREERAEDGGLGEMRLLERHVEDGDCGQRAVLRLCDAREKPVDEVARRDRILDAEQRNEVDRGGQAR